MEAGENGEQVMSEVHLGCPPHFSDSYVTHFTFSLPPKANFIGEKMISLDKDGDLDLARRKGDQSHAYDTECQSFKFDDDGDLVLDRKRRNCGLVGIVLARIAKTVFLTDCGNEILENCEVNVHLSSGFSELNEASIHVRELNWKEPWPPHTVTAHKSKYSWTASEVAEAEGAALILAADVIYGDDLTESFFNILEKLMSRGSEKVLYLALEKRYNFSLDDLDVVANGYAKFRSFFKDEKECSIPDDMAFPCFVGVQIDIFKIPQYIREYERSRDLELWRIRYCANRSQLL